MKWDILDINLPWRYFISECLQNGFLPLWNPYINCGFPQTADPMTWYPVSWAIGLIFGNDLISLQYEYLFHIFIGGIGLYKLGVLLKLNRETRLIISISFMFSGLFISNAQHFGWIVSAAWFPLILYYYILFCKTLKIKYGIIFILFLFFQLTGGYAGFFIITVYILIALFLYFLFGYLKEKIYVKYVLTNVILAIIFILLSSVVLVSSIELSLYLTRYNQLNIDYVISYALPVRALISFILPFATTTNTEYWGADSSLINCYFGIIPFVFLIYSILVIKKTKLRILFFIGLLFLCTALADIFPFRKWLFYLPFMNIFRFPNIFRFFAYVIFLIVSGIGINYFLKENKKETLLKNIILALTGVIITFFIYNSLYIEKWKFKKLISFDLKTFLDTASIHDRIVLQAFIVIAILTTFYIILRRLKGKKRNILLILVVIFDMIIATQLNIYHTVIDYTNPKATQQTIKNLPGGIPIPDINEKIKDINDLTAPAIPFLWRNLNIYHKKTSYTGYSPYYFTAMYKSETEGLIHSVIKNPLFYLSDSIHSNYVIDSLSIDSLSSKKIKIKAFNPNQVELNVKSDKKQLLTFVQNYYPGWKAYVNEAEVDLIRSNYTFMSLWIPNGENTVVFKYEPKNILIAFYISTIVLFVLLIFLLINTFKLYRSQITLTRYH
ncbi:YfhO family protein [Bacteroidota bacterium]